MLQMVFSLLDGLGGFDLSSSGIALCKSEDVCSSVVETR